MGKSIRSKSKRANRTLFRQTHGKDYIEKQRSVIQGKLQECADKGAMNSFDRLSTMLDTEPAAPSAMTGGEDVPHSSFSDLPDAMDTSLGKKNGDKVPAKKTTKKKHMIDIAPGQHGAKLARKKVSKMKKRGQVKKGQRVLRKSRGGIRKKKQLCAF